MIVLAWIAGGVVAAFLLWFAYIQWLFSSGGDQ